MPTTAEVVEIKPQPGPQTRFLECEADICIFGGGAGGGKSHGLLLDPLRHLGTPGFGCVLFRRVCPELTRSGGLWPESHKLYGLLGGTPRSTDYSWTWPNQFTISMSHMQYEQDMYSWQGSQIAQIGFDELTHFTEAQFWYMVSRNRSVCGIRPYIRATTNPDPDSWVRRFIAWWIDERTGFPIPERDGVLRWFVRRGDEMLWETDPGKLPVITAENGLIVPPRSVTFIRSSLFDNQILLNADPGYLTSMMSLPRVERERLLAGNWNIKFAAGLYFKREHFKIVDAAPAARGLTLRYWDRAATEPGPQNADPDWTAGCKMTRGHDGVMYILDMVKDRVSPQQVKEMIRNIASQDGPETEVVLEQDPGQAGKAEQMYLSRELHGLWFSWQPVPTGDKGTRCKPLSAQVEAGNVALVRGPWNESFIRECEGFDGGEQAGHDDQVDAASGAYNRLSAAGVPRMRQL